MGRKDERGAVAVFLAAMLALIIGLGALAVDLGMQRVVRRDMQALADVVALALARELDGRSATALAAELQRGDPDSALSQSLLRNDDHLGENLRVAVTLGQWINGSFVLTGAVPSAVRVVATADVGFGFAGGRGAASGSAVAQSSSTACFKLGSYVAAVRSQDSEVLSLLDELIGLDLSLLHYEQLAAADLRLTQLVADARIGTPERLLQSSVQVSTLISVIISALNAENTPASTAAATLLNQKFVGLALTNPSIALGQVLSIAPTDVAALETELNVLDLVAALVQVANGRHAIEIPNVQAGVPGLGDVDGSLYIQQRAQLACGVPHSAEATATTSQVWTDATVKFLNMPSLNIGSGFLIGGTLQTSKADGRVNMTLGNATATLVDDPPVYCGQNTAADPSTFSVSVTPGLVDYSITADFELSGRVSILGLFNKTISARVNMRLAAPQGASSVAALGIPPNDQTAFQTGTSVGVLGSLQPVITVTVDPISLSATEELLLGGVGQTLNSLVNGIVTAVTAGVTGPNGFAEKTIRPFANNLDTMVIDPVGELLGLRVGGADVYAVSAFCNVPIMRQ